MSIDVVALTLAEIFDCCIVFWRSIKVSNPLALKTIELTLLELDSRSISSNPYPWGCRPAGIDTTQGRPLQPRTVTFVRCEQGVDTNTRVSRSLKAYLLCGYKHKNIKVTKKLIHMLT